MTTPEYEQKGARVILGIGAVIGSIFGIWALTTLTTGLSSMNWQISEMYRHFLIATGNLEEYETMVDYYTHINGLEFLLAVAFFVAFPIFFKYLHKSCNKA